MDPVIGVWADAAGHPSGAALAAAGFRGVAIYVGTPASPKDCPAAVYADYVAHGLGVIAVYENVANDIATGAAGGQAHAQAALADMAAKGIPAAVPLGATADEHLTAAMVSLAVQYQGAFFDTVKATHPGQLVVAYGFSEFLTAVRAAGKADVFWQAGTAPAAGAGVHFWQRNVSPSTATVGGVTVDIDDQLLPIPGDDVNLTDQIAVTNGTVTLPASTVGAALGRILFELTYPIPSRASINADPKQVDTLLGRAADADGHSYDNTQLLHQVLTQLTAIQGALSAEQAALLAAIQGATQPVVTDAQLADLEANLAAALPAYTVSIAPKTTT